MSQLQGTRLSDVARAYSIKDQSIADICTLRISDALSFWKSIALSPTESAIAKLPLELLLKRLATFCDVGIGYLNLDRSAKSLSGGESQRLRLATQLGAELTQSIYVLDEPTIGLHPRDTARLMTILRRLQARSNTVVLVEHDLEVIEQSDHIIDLGPGAGEHGGLVMGSGTPAQIIKQKTLTGQYLDKKPDSDPKRDAGPKLVQLEYYLNNLKSVNVRIPMGCLTVVTGVSGSGKSSLVMGALQEEANKTCLHQRRTSPLQSFPSSIKSPLAVHLVPHQPPTPASSIQFEKLYAAHPESRPLATRPSDSLLMPKKVAVCIVKDGVPP